MRLKLRQLGLGLAELGNIELLQKRYPTVFGDVRNAKILNWIKKYVDDGYCAK